VYVISLLTNSGGFKLMVNNQYKVWYTFIVVGVSIFNVLSNSGGLVSPQSMLYRTKGFIIGSYL